MTALAEFNGGLARCRLLRGIENEYPDPPTTAFEQQTVESLRASVAVLMVASFEEFVRQLFRDKLPLLSVTMSGFNLSAYHEVLRAESIFRGLLLAYQGPRDNRKRNVSRRAEIVTICNAIISDEIVVEALSDVGSNPSGDQIVTMLEQLGIKAASTALDKRYRSQVGPCSAGFVVDRINNIVTIRHGVAHTGRASRLSRLDLDNNLVFLQQTARVIITVLDDFVAETKRAAALTLKLRKIDI